jgi:hypothetical protein
MRIVVALAVAATLGASAASAQPGSVESVFRAQGLPLHVVDRFALLITRKGHTVLLSFNVFGRNPQPRFLALEREKRGLEVIVFKTRTGASGSAPLYAHNPLAAAMTQGPVMVVYDREIDPAVLRRARAAVHALPK